MENEKKYIITIDGTDCTGKTTLWKNTTILNNETKNVQIRGIVSNIAYAIKFGRNVDELIDLYNQNPVNYVVYLINPINDKKLEMLYNRLRNDCVCDNERIEKELKDASETWCDMVYFNKAIELLNKQYKGEIIVIKALDNTFDNFKKYYKIYENSILAPKDVEDNKSIKIIKSNYTNFEKRAKEASEFKYIVLFEEANKDDIITELVRSLDNEHYNMFNNLYNLTNLSYEDIYNDMDHKDYEFTNTGLREYLDDYNIDCTSDTYVTLRVYTDHSIKLSDLKHKSYYDLEDCIFDSEYEIDSINDNLKNELDYADYESFSVELR